jgi:hypothetical protein
MKLGEARALALASVSLLAQVIVSGQPVGPLVGTVDQTSAYFLYRPGEETAEFRLSILQNGETVAETTSPSLAEDDYVAKFSVEGLLPQTDYHYQLRALDASESRVIAASKGSAGFRTAPIVGEKAVTRVAFVSCANGSSESVWQRIGELDVDRLVLLGDTPYVDTANLGLARSKHRDFLRNPGLAALIKSIPTVATWDDHDFGANNGNGLSFEGKAATRQAFVEYRAHARYGTGTEGVFHRLDLGNLEIFLLDPRWFSQTAGSPADPSQPTCLGAEQWQWLRNALIQSRAPFKALAMGQIWQDKKNGENDDMFTYHHERDALLDFIRDQQIPGVILMGGDIHLSRHLVHPRRLDYDLHDFITSPAHGSVIPSLDVAHPDLEWSLVEPYQFLVLTVDTRPSDPKLIARFYTSDGLVRRTVELTLSELSPTIGSGLGRGLRAWWPFDNSFENHSILRGRINAEAINGASLDPDGGLRGAAARFKRNKDQYLHVSRNALDDNSSQFACSLWFRAGGLPPHGSDERHFLVESIQGRSPGDEAGYTISAGLRAGENSNEVRLQFYTHTLATARLSNEAPEAIAQGPFDLVLARDRIRDKWMHLVLNFDSQKLEVFFQGDSIASYSLPIPGASSEFSGLILAGHRAGAGRNFDGWIDEVGLWQRNLSADEIASLYNGGKAIELSTNQNASDRDGDSMPDWYERLHGLDPGAASDALSDLDDDGLPAWLEHRVGTHPNFDDQRLFRAILGEAHESRLRKEVYFPNPSTGEINLQLEALTSPDLDLWEVSPPGDGHEFLSEDGTLWMQFQQGDESKQFFRLRVIK